MADGRDRARKRLQAVPTEADSGAAGAGGLCNTLRKDGSGERCRQKAGAGTDHLGFGACRNHGGTSPSLRIHAAKQQVRALAAAKGATPAEAVAGLLRRSASAVGHWRGELEQLADAGADLADVEGEDPEAQKRARTLARVLSGYGEERDRLAEAAKLAIVSRVVAVAPPDHRLVVRDGEVESAWFPRLRAVLRCLTLTEAQREAADEVVRANLRALGDRVVVVGALDSYPDLVATPLAGEVNTDPYECLSLLLALSAGAVEGWAADVARLTEAGVTVDDLESDDPERRRLAVALRLATAAYADERDRLGRVAKTAIGAGLAEADLAERNRRVAWEFGTLLDDVLADLFVADRVGLVEAWIVKRRVLNGDEEADLFELSARASGLLIREAHR